MTNQNDDVVEIFTDGACQPNPGPGGWAAVIHWRDRVRTISGGEQDTTNNQMELMATIMALETLTRPMDVVVVTDSQYVKNGITTWITKWRLNGWRTSTGAPVKNVELWTRLDAQCKRHNVTWRWVKGHNGHPQNELADKLAVAAIPRLRGVEIQKVFVDEFIEAAK